MKKNYNWSSIEDQLYGFLKYRDFDNFLKLLSKSLSPDTSTSETFQNGEKNELMLYLILYIEKYKIVSFVKKHKKMPLKSIMLNFLRKDLSDFEHKLNNYLNKCIKNYRDVYGISYYNIGESLLDCLSSDSAFSLINFNYTKPSKNYTESHDELLYSVRNIHGVLQENKYDFRQSPIIGISDDKISINDPSFIFTKNYRIMRLSCNRYNNILKPNVKNIIFFGHSFDKADYNYFFDIFDRYKIYDIQHSNVRLIFYYVNYNGQSDNAAAAVNQINNVNRLFEDYCIRRFSDANKKAKYLLQTLSFEGRIVISNLYQKIHNAKSNLNPINEYISIIDDMKRLFTNIYNLKLAKDVPNRIQNIIRSTKNIIELANILNKKRDQKGLKGSEINKHTVHNYRIFLKRLTHIYTNDNLDDNKKILNIIRDLKDIFE